MVGFIFSFLPTSVSS